jgi:tripartite ATP-independent transporter DctP family solute receptor
MTVSDEAALNPAEDGELTSEAGTKYNGKPAGGAARDRDARWSAPADRKASWSATFHDNVDSIPIGGHDEWGSRPFSSGGKHESRTVHATKFRRRARGMRFANIIPYAPVKNGRKAMYHRGGIAKAGCACFGALAIALGLMGQAAAQKIIRLGHSEGTDTQHGQVIQIFKRHVETATKGEIRVQVFPNLQLGKVIEQIEGVKSGTQEMMISTPAWFSRFYRTIDVLSLPYMIPDWEAAERVLTSDVLRELAAEAEKATGIKVLGVFALGYRNVNNARRPIETPEDMAGLKIRIQNSPVYISLMKALKANPTPMDAGEIYQGIQTGVVDGHETLLPLIEAVKYYEVAPYVSLTQHTHEVFLVYLNQKFYNDLTPEHKQAVDTAMRAAEIAGLVIAKASEDKALRALVAAGAKVNKLPKAAMAKLQKMVQPVYDEFGPQFEPWLSKLRKVAAGE